MRTQNRHIPFTGQLKRLYMDFASELYIFSLLVFLTFFWSTMYIYITYLRTTQLLDYAPPPSCLGRKKNSRMLYKHHKITFIHFSQFNIKTKQPTNQTNKQYNNQIHKELLNASFDHLPANWHSVMYTNKFYYSLTPETYTSRYHGNKT